MDEYNIYEGAFSGPQIDSILGNSTRQDAIAIVSNNNTHIAITAGQYVYVKGHGTLAEGMYKANSNIAANGTLTSSNLTAVSNGVANELKAAIPPIKAYTQTSSSSVSSVTLPAISDIGLLLVKSGANSGLYAMNSARCNNIAGDYSDITTDGNTSGQTITFTKAAAHNIMLLYM